MWYHIYLVKCYGYYVLGNFSDALGFHCMVTCKVRVCKLCPFDSDNIFKVYTLIRHFSVLLENNYLTFVGWAFTYLSYLDRSSAIDVSFRQ